MEGGKGKLVGIYTFIGVATFVGMWGSVAWFLLAGGGPADFVAALLANPAVLMLTIEMGAMAIVSSLLMYNEAQRFQIGNPWPIIVLAIVVGFGVVFPLFLAARQRRLRTEPGRWVPVP